MPTRGVPFLMFPSRTGKGEKPHSPRGWERSPESENRERERKETCPSRKTASPGWMKRFSSMVTHTVFLHGPAGGTGGRINVAADGFHVLAHSANRMAGNTPEKGGDTQNNQFGFHRFIGRVPNNQTPFLQPPFKEPMIMPHCPLSFSGLAMRTRNT